MSTFALERPAAEALLGRIVERTMRMDMLWDWPCGVAYYGVCRAWEATGKQEYLDAVRARVDEYIQLGLPALTVNTCAMGHCLLTLFEATGDKKYWEVIETQLDFLQHKSLRFGEGVLQHVVSVNNDFPEQAWADTLFMAAYFMLRAGVHSGDEDLIHDALEQFYWHIRYLQDPASGLWYHGYDNLSGGHMSGVYWGRANAWAAYTMSRVGKVLPKAYLYPRFMDVSGSLAELLAGVKLLQTENGLWRTVLNDPESYEEVSASCGIAAAMAEGGNPLHRKYVDRFLAALPQQIAPDGRVLHVSAGTAIMNTPEDYRRISRDWPQGWGQGLALAVLASVLEAE